MSITMDTALASLVPNKRRVSALKSLGVTTVGEALTYYPFRVTEPVPLRTIREAVIGQQMAFAAQVRDVRVVQGRMSRVIATVDDTDYARTRHMPGGIAQLTFFGGRKNYVDWVARRLKSSPILVVSGVPSEYMGQLQFTHPDIVTVAPGPAGTATGSGGENSIPVLRPILHPRALLAHTRISSLPPIGPLRRLNMMPTPWRTPSPASAVPGRSTTPAHASRPNIFTRRFWDCCG